MKFTCSYPLEFMGSSAVYGKMFLVTIILKNLCTLKAALGQTVEMPAQLIREGLQIIWNSQFSIIHYTQLSRSAHKCAKKTYLTRLSVK